MRPQCSEDAVEPGSHSQQAHGEVYIREIAHGDAEAVAQLSAELGYPADADEMKRRIENANTSPDRTAYVACLSSVVVAWIDIGIVHHLSTGAFGEISGLVVSSRHRSEGIGRKLVAQAEAWVASRGVARMVVRSRVSREAAHRFYLREGYSLVKTSVTFEKRLGATGG